MPSIIAHRGLRNEAPENTLAAISSALRLPGIGGVEFDVELTADKRAVVLHQETLVVDGSGTRLELASRNFTSRDWVGELTADRVKMLDAGSWMGPPFSNLRVPSLEEVLSLPWGDVTACVELKDATYWGAKDPERPRLVVESVSKALDSFDGSLEVLSFNPEILRLIRDRIPTVRTTLALWTEWRDRQGEAVAEAHRCGAATISLPDILVLEAPSWIAAACDAGLAIHAYPVSPARDEAEFERWTPDSQHDKWRRLHDLGLAGILTDFGRETVAFLSEPGPSPLEPG